MTNFVTDVIYQTNWVTNIITITNEITPVEIVNSGWNWGLTVQILVALITIATVVIMMKTQREVQQARKEETEENQKIRELNMLMIFIEKYEPHLLLSSRDLIIENINNKIDLLYKEYLFIIKLEGMMKSMKYYNRSWILKDAMYLLQKTSGKENKFSYHLIKKLEEKVCISIELMPVLLLQDKIRAKEEIKNIFDNEFKSNRKY